MVNFLNPVFAGLAAPSVLFAIGGELTKSAVLLAVSAVGFLITINGCPLFRR